MRYLIASLLVFAIAAPAPAAAQCASCGNPAFASGDNDVSRTMDTKGAVDEWRVRAALVYGTMVSDEYFEGSESWGNPDNFKMTMHLLTLSTTVASPWGTSLSALVPWGSLQLEKNFLDDQEADVGLGDVELRLRHDVSRFWGSKGPRVVLSLGGPCRPASTWRQPPPAERTAASTLAAASAAVALVTSAVAAAVAALTTQTAAVDISRWGETFCGCSRTSRSSVR